jgi:hypothetical protein
MAKKTAAPKPRPRIRWIPLPLDTTQTVRAFQLPANSDVKILAAALTGAVAVFPSRGCATDPTEKTRALSPADLHREAASPTMAS